MIYVPASNTFNKCYVVINEDIIRAFDTIPSYNTSYNYRDYYIHSDYIYKDGSGQWSNYSSLPVCLSTNDISTNYYYRVDFANILIIFACFFLFIVYFPIKLFFRIFGRWLKL